MEREIFDHLFKLSVTELNDERSKAWDRWTWDSGSKKDKETIKNIDTVLKARDRLGLTGAENSAS